MGLNSDFDEMARENYGYGRWGAPYWFLGPEQGMDPNEDDLVARVQAWRHFGSSQLDDCREFHLYLYPLIDAKKICHGEGSSLQRTWGRLLSTLIAFPGGPANGGSRLSYQQEKWGSSKGDACVVELSGLAARNLKEKRERTRFRQERIGVIREKIQEHKPDFVIMYGKSCWDAYEEIGGALDATRIPKEEFAFSNAEVSRFNEFRRCGRTVLALTRHPVRGPADEKWEKLGTVLRHLVNRSPQG